jgi:hypothetical protein
LVSLTERKKNKTTVIQHKFRITDLINDSRRKSRKKNITIDRKHNDSNFKRKKSVNVDQLKTSVSPRIMNNSDFIISPEPLLDHKNRPIDPKFEEPFWKKELKTPYKPNIEK